MCPLHVAGAILLHVVDYLFPTHPFNTDEIQQHPHSFIAGRSLQHHES